MASHVREWEARQDASCSQQRHGQPKVLSSSELQANTAPMAFFDGCLSLPLYPLGSTRIRYPYTTYGKGPYKWHAINSVKP